MRQDIKYAPIGMISQGNADSDYLKCQYINCGKKLLTDFDYQKYCSQSCRDRASYLRKQTTDKERYLKKKAENKLRGE